MVEQLTLNQRVGGSSPPRFTKSPARVSQRELVALLGVVAYLDDWVSTYLGPKVSDDGPSWRISIRERNRGYPGIVLYECKNKGLTEKAFRNLLILKGRHGCWATRWFAKNAQAKQTKKVMLRDGSQKSGTWTLGKEYEVTHLCPTGSRGTLLRLGAGVELEGRPVEGVLENGVGVRGMEKGQFGVAKCSGGVFALE